MANGFFVLIVGLLGWCFFAECAVFVNQEEASALLHRYKRHNTGFLEEILQGNLERECIEEVCDYEEAREVFENDGETIRFWKKYKAYNKCTSDPCVNGGQCQENLNDYLCLCPAGYEGKNCNLDVTCSTRNGGCKQICENGPTGKAACSCASGYRLMEDQKSCEPIVPFPCGRITAPEALKNISSRESNRKAPSIPLGPTPTPFQPIDTSAGKGEVPWQVHMLSYERSGMCGGAIINEKWVVTTAQCLQFEPHTVVAGDHNMNVFEHSEQLRRVVKAIPYPTYNSSSKYHHGIALLELDSPLTLNHYVTPICLADKQFTNDLLQHGLGTVSGWWRLTGQWQRASNLQVMRVNLIDQATCLRSTAPSTILPNMFCAGLPAPLRKTHQGDSGNPYATYIGDTWFLTAVTTCEECAGTDKYNIYTGVADYIQWIKNATKLI